MSGDALIADLQRIAARFDYYEGDEPDPIGVMLDALQTAHPEATPEQLLLAVRRAEFELTFMIADVDGWWSDFKYDVEDPRWQTLERMKGHAWLLTEVEINIEAAFDDETHYLINELHDEIGERLLVLGPGDRLAAEIVPPPLVMIVDRNDAGPEVFDQPSLDRLLRVAKIFCVRCMRNFRGDAQLVRDTAMGMAAGMCPTGLGDFNAVQHFRPAGPAVLLVMCLDGGKDFQREVPDAWIDAWEARGISIYTARDRRQDIADARRAAAENGISLHEALIHVWGKETKRNAELWRFIHGKRGGDKEPA